jgi:hypothetical protein
MQTIRIDFCVAGNVRQTIELVDENITPEQFVEKLRRGDYVASIGFEQNHTPKIMELPSLRIVGRVVEQVPLDDVQLDEFEVCDHDDDDDDAQK